MVREVLSIKTDTGASGNDPTFHGIELTEYEYSASRMGMPQLKATLMYDTCLDSEWSGTEYVEFRGERYYLRDTPASTKSNTDARYKHELVFRSERDELLGNLLFFDVVPKNASSDSSITADKPNTNSTDFTFYGDIREFVDRLNCALLAAGVGDTILGTKTYLTTEDVPVGDGYCAMVEPYGDDDIYAVAELSFSDKYLWEAITEAYNTYKIPFEFRGKKIVFNPLRNEIDHVFQYGHNNSLLSVSKKNANARLVNRITMVGSSENIPYYYPNETEYGHIELDYGTNTVLTANRIRIQNPHKLIQHVRADEKITLVKKDDGSQSPAWQVGEIVYDDAAKLGLRLRATPTSGWGESISWISTGLIRFQGNLMPPKYRVTNGKERFYDALNDTYLKPDTTDEYYVFPNPLADDKHKFEYIHRNDEIKPTIEDIKNQNDELFGEIIGVAYDLNDNDELKQSGDEGDALKYQHSFFYIKLNIFDGKYGFDLFDSASQQDAMTIQMTSGNCNGCKFKIQALEKVDEGGFNYYQNPVQTVGPNASIVAGDYEDKVKKDNIQPWQQNTRLNSIWICVQKDVETFGTIYPSQASGIVPKVGDTFNITNIDLPVGYVETAEKRLEDDGIATMADMNEEKFTFDISASRIFFAQNPEILSQLDEYSKLKVSYNDKLYSLFVSQFSVSCKNSEVLPDIKVSLTDTISVGEGLVKKIVNETLALMPTYRGYLTSSAAERRYLNKQMNDRTPFDLNVGGKFTAEQGTQFGPDFDPNILTGFGGLVDRSGNAWFESMTIRRFLEVPEMRYNRTDVSVGNQWHAPGGGLVSDVTETTSSEGHVTLKLEDGEIGSVAVGDICMGIFHSLDPTENSDEYIDDYEDMSFPGFCTVYFEITAVDDDGMNGGFNYRLRPNTTAHPCAFMTFVAYGNFTKTERMSSRYSTRTYERYLRGVDDWTFGTDNVAAQFGDLSNLTIDGKVMTGYSAYIDNIYMRGVIEALGFASYWIETNTQVVNEDADGTRSPALITAKAYKRSSTGVVSEATDCKLMYSYKKRMVAIGGSQEVTEEMPASGIVVPDKSSLTGITFPVTIKLVKDSKDMAAPVVIPIVKDGLKGEDGRYTENMFTGTKDFSGDNWRSIGNWVREGEYNGLSVLREREGNAWSGLSQLVRVEKDERYTYSAFIRREGTGDSYFFTTGGDGDTSPNSVKIEGVTSSWKRLSVSFTATKSGTIQPRFESASEDDTMYIAGIKLERGEATDTVWTPNPADLQGPRGVDGSIYRVTEWSLSTRYYDGKTDNAEDPQSPRFLDIVTITSADGMIRTIWQCISTHVSTESTRPDSSGGATYWRQFSSMTPVYTPLLLADNAKITFVNSNEILIVDSGNKVVGRFGCGPTPLWVGGNSATTAKFTVAENGMVRFGQDGGQRIVLDPADNGMKIFDEEGRNTEFVGKRVLDVSSYFKWAEPTISVLQKSKTLAGDSTPLTSSYLVGRFTLKTSSTIRLKATFKCSTATKYQPSIGIKIFDVTDADNEIEVFAKTTTDAQYFLNEAVPIKIEEERSYNVVISAYLPRETVYPSMDVSDKYELYSSASWSDLVIEASSEAYKATYMSNGFAIGNASDNYVSAYENADGDMCLEAVSRGKGIRINANGAMASVGNSQWGLIPRIAVHAWIDYNSSTNAYSYGSRVTADGITLGNITRTSTGNIRIALSGIRDTARTQSCVTGRYTPVEAAVGDFTASYINLRLFHNGSAFDGGFFLTVYEF